MRWTTDQLIVAFGAGLLLGTAGGVLMAALWRLSLALQHWRAGG